MKGAHPIHRKLLDHKLWQHKPFARGQAWVDLILLANHKDDGFFINNRLMPIKRGQVFRSYVNLAKRWGWSINKVKRFFVVLKNEKMIEYSSDQYGIYITLLNYDKLHHEAFVKISESELPDELPSELPDELHTIMSNNDNNEKRDNMPISKKRKPANPDVKIFIDYFFKKHQEVVGEKYHVQGGKDGNIVKLLLGTYELKKLKRFVDVYFWMEDDWILQQGYSIPKFNVNLDKIIRAYKEILAKKAAENGKKC